MSSPSTTLLIIIIGGSERRCQQVRLTRGVCEAVGLGGSGAADG